MRDVAGTRKALSFERTSGDGSTGNIEAKIKLDETSWICRRKSAI